MSYNKHTEKNEDQTRRVNLDEVVEDEFSLSKKKQPAVDSKTESDGTSNKNSKRVNLNESE